MSATPSLSHDWWSSFLLHVTQEPRALPHQWSWHMEGGEESTDMGKAMASFQTLLSSFKVEPELARDVNINEYAVYGEQLPSAGAWWIAGLERENAHGLRGNWAIAGALHDFLAGSCSLESYDIDFATDAYKGLLSKPDAGTENYVGARGDYWPTAEYQVYKYYASVMTGQRLKTKPTPEALMDVYATTGEGVIRVLAGTRSRPGDWAIDIVGLPTSRRARVRTFAFSILQGDRFKRVDAPEDLGETEQVVREGRLRVAMQHNDPGTAFAFEVVLLE